MSNRVLIVCAGNICRSPTAEVLLRRRLSGTSIIVESAGLAAVEGSGIAPLAEKVLAEHGLTAKSHTARRINQPLIESAQIVLAMEKRHLAALRVLSPHARSKAFLLGKWQGGVDIPDPYGRQQSAFELAFEMMDAAVDSWCTHLLTRL